MCNIALISIPIGSGQNSHASLEQTTPNIEGIGRTGFNCHSDPVQNNFRKFIHSLATRLDTYLDSSHLFCSALLVPKKPRQKLTSPRASRLPREWRTSRPVMRPGIPTSFLRLPLSRCNTCSVLRREVLEGHLTESFWIITMCHWFLAIHTEHRLRRRHADRG
jgi:hypothetical protein